MARRRTTRRPHGQGTTYERTPGNWWVSWRENGRRRAKGGFPSRDYAERVLTKIVSELQAGRVGLPPDPRGVPPLSELAEPWLKVRKTTHRAGPEDEYRWKKHLAPHFGHLRPSEVDQGSIRRFVDAKREEGLNPATIRILVAILSSLFVDLLEQGKAPANPCRGLPRATMRLIRPTHDPRTTPFIEKLSDVRRIYLALHDASAGLATAYAIGALAGLRTGEVFALRWAHVDLVARRIHVRESVKGPLKDKDSRMVPVLDSLLPILNAWKLKTGGAGQVIPPLRCDGKKIDKATPGNYLRPVLAKLGLAREGLGWYEATRHTFASQWVMAGGSIEKLKEILGHYSVIVTERYAHLRPDLFVASDLATIALDLAPAGAEVVALDPARQG